MSVRTRDWLKFIALVGLAFVFGLVLSLALSPRADAQQMRYMTGQNIVIDGGRSVW